jgi:molybdopterin converting factor subunit 1
VRVTVRLFAHVRETAGIDTVDLELGSGSVGEIRSALADRLPAAAGLIARSALAVNSEYAPDDRAVSAADEVALIPPVSGG